MLKPLGTFLVEFLIFYLSRGFEAKDKIVRYRSCQLIGFLLEFLSEAE